MESIGRSLDTLGYTDLNYLQLSFSAMVAALFLQSGIDKVVPSLEDATSLLRPTSRIISLRAR